MKVFFLLNITAFFTLPDYIREDTVEKKTAPLPLMKNKDNYLCLINSFVFFYQMVCNACRLVYLLILRFSPTYTKNLYHGQYPTPLQNFNVLNKTGIEWIITYDILMLSMSIGYILNEFMINNYFYKNVICFYMIYNPMIVWLLPIRIIDYFLGRVHISREIVTGIYSNSKKYNMSNKYESSTELAFTSFFLSMYTGWSQNLSCCNVEKKNYITTNEKFLVTIRTDIVKEGGRFFYIAALFTKITFTVTRWAMILCYKKINVYFNHQFNIVPLKNTFRFIFGKTNTILPFCLNRKQKLLYSLPLFSHIIFLPLILLLYFLILGIDLFLLSIFY